MNVEGQVSIVFLYLALGVAAVFLLILFVQYTRKKRLEKELDTITLHYQQHIASSQPKHTDLFAESPYPVCIIDRQGNITGSNRHFLQLVRPAKIMTLQDFDHLTHADLRSMAHTHGVHSGLITIKDDAHESFRQFMVVSWPLIVAKAEVGRVVTLHEQTNVIRRKNHQAEFERELITCMQLLSSELSEALRSGLRDVAAVRTLNDELADLSAYLLNLHAPLRQQVAFKHQDIVPIVKEVVTDVRQLARKNDTSFAVTLPHSSGIKVEYETFKLALTTMLTGLLEFGGSSLDVIRVHIEGQGHNRMLTVASEDLALTEQQLGGIFTFGALPHLQHNVRNLHLRAAIARELCEKQGVSLKVVSHADLGTIFMFTVAGVPRI